MVYVDELQKTVKEQRGKKWHYPYFCHLTADTLDELHKFAFDIGLKREWFQDHPNHPHYDLVSNKRRIAVEKGAIEKCTPKSA